MTTLTTLTFNTAKTSPLIYNGYTFVTTNSPTNTIFTNNDGMTSTSNAWTGDTTIVSANFPTTLTSIDGSAFSNASNFTTITFDPSSSLTSFDTSAFNNSGLTSIIIPNSVTTIGQSVFQACSSLTSVTFEATSSVTSIGINAFLNTALTTINIPSSVITMNDSAFQSCSSLATITFESPSSLTTIGTSAFQSSGLTSIIIPNSVTSLGYSSFLQCFSLSSVTFEATSSLTTIGGIAFYDCRLLTSITFNTPSLTTIGANAFEIPSHIPNAGLITVIIPNSVTSIGNDAFQTTNLTWVDNSSPSLTFGNTTVFPTAFNNASKTLFTSSSSNPIYSYIQTNYPLTTIVVGPSCYNENVNILTDNGYIPINQIQIGASIKTLNDGYKKVIKTHFQPFNANHSHFGSTMYKLKLDNEFKELNITGNHCILLDEYDNHMDATVNSNKDEWMIDGKHISVAGKNPNFEKMPETSYMVYHLVLENDDAKRRYAIFANGILSESMSEGHYDEIRCLV